MFSYPLFYHRPIGNKFSVIYYNKKYKKIKQERVFFIFGTAVVPQKPAVNACFDTAQPLKPMSKYVILQEDCQQRPNTALTIAVAYGLKTDNFTDKYAKTAARSFK